MYHALPTQRRRAGFSQRTGPERVERCCGNPMHNNGPPSIAKAPTTKRKSMNYEVVRAEALQSDTKVKT